MRKQTSTNYQNEEKVLETCPIYSATRLISSRWRTHILWFLRKGPLRFGQIRREIPLATERMIALRIQDLQKDGLIEKVLDKDLIVYRLSKKGQKLIPVLRALLKVPTTKLKK